MRRRLLNLLTALSLLLCVAATVLWVRSYAIGDGFQMRVPSGRCTLLNLHSGHARLSFGFIRYDAPVRPDSRDERWVCYEEQYPFALTELKPQSVWARLGFGRAAWRSFPLSPHSRLCRWVVVPAWLVVSLAAVAPGLRLYHFVRQRRATASGLCPSCGYDLRATPDRCPECGAAASVTPSA